MTVASLLSPKTCRPPRPVASLGGLGVSRKGPKCGNGAEGQTRTVDTGIFSAVLYHLSYLGKPLYLKRANPRLSSLPKLPELPWPSTLTPGPSPTGRREASNSLSLWERAGVRGERLGEAGAQGNHEKHFTSAQLGAGTYLDSDGPRLVG